MVTEFMARKVVNAGLISFLMDNKCGDMEFDLLRFMGRHLHAKLNFYVITQSFRLAASDLGNALMSLVERGILLHQLGDNNLVTYSVSTDAGIRAHVSELASLGWSTAMSLKKELKERVVCCRAQTQYRRSTHGKGLSSDMKIATGVLTSP